MQKVQKDTQVVLQLLEMVRGENWFNCPMAVVSCHQTLTLLSTYQKEHKLFLKKKQNRSLNPTYHITQKVQKAGSMLLVMCGITLKIHLRLLVKFGTILH